MKWRLRRLVPAPSKIPSQDNQYSHSLSLPPHVKLHKTALIRTIGNNLFLFPLFGVSEVDSEKNEKKAATQKTKRLNINILFQAYVSLPYPPKNSE
jgi:hypothetical protein